MDPTYNPLIPYSLITVLIPPINPLYLGTAELISFYLKTFSLSVGAVHNKASINPAPNPANRLMDVEYYFLVSNLAMNESRNHLLSLDTEKNVKVWDVTTYVCI